MRNPTNVFFAALAIASAIALSACSTQQTQTALTVACTADALAPSIVKAGTAVALISDPTAVQEVTAANAADAAVHPVVQAACAAALPGSVPVAGTVNPVSVPVAPPVSQTTAVILPVSPTSPAQK